MIKQFKQEHALKVKNFDLSYNSIKSWIPENRRKDFIKHAMLLSKIDAKSYSGNPAVERLGLTGKDVLFALKTIAINLYTESSNNLDNAPKDFAELTEEDCRGIFNITSKFLISEYVSMVFEVGAEAMDNIGYIDGFNDFIDTQEDADITF